MPNIGATTRTTGTAWFLNFSVSEIIVRPTSVLQLFGSTDIQLSTNFTAFVMDFHNFTEVLPRIICTRILKCVGKIKTDAVIRLLVIKYSDSAPQSA